MGIFFPSYKYLHTYLLLLYYGYPSLLENTIPFFLPIISLCLFLFLISLSSIFIIHTRDEPYNLTILNIFVVEGRCKFLLCPELFDTDGVHMTIVFFLLVAFFFISLTLIQDYLQIFIFLNGTNKTNRISLRLLTRNAFKVVKLHRPSPCIIICVVVS